MGSQHAVSLTFSRDPSVTSWVQGLGQYAFFVTATKRFDRTTDEAFRGAVKYFLNRLNRAVFGRQGRKGRRSLASFVSIEHGATGGRLHAHIALGKPRELPLRESKRIVLQVLKLVRSFGYCDVRPYRSERHISYLLKSGQDSIYFEVCNPEK